MTTGDSDDGKGAGGDWSIGVAGDLVFEELRVRGDFDGVEAFRSTCAAWRDAVDATPARDVLAWLPRWKHRESYDWTRVLKSLIHDAVFDARAGVVAAWMIRRLRADLVRLKEGPGRFFVRAVDADRMDLAEILLSECGAGSFRRDDAYESMLWAIERDDRTKIERLAEMFGRERELCYRAACRIVRTRRRRPSNEWMRACFGMAYDGATDRVVIVPNGRAAGPVHSIGELIEAAARGDTSVALVESAWWHGRLDLAERMRSSTGDSGYANFRWLVAGLSERGMVDDLVAFSRYASMLPSWIVTRNDCCEAVRLAFAYDRTDVLDFLVCAQYMAPIQMVPWCTDASTALKAIEAFGDFSALTWARAHGAARSLAWYETKRR